MAFACPASLLAQTPLDQPDAGPATDAGTVLPPAPAIAPQVATPASPSPLAELPVAQVGTRLAVRVQNPNSPDKFNDAGSNGEAEVVLLGRVHPFLKWQAGFLGTYGAPGATATSATVLDLVGKIELADAFNLWIGRMPIPSDRASLSTEWALGPWTMPGSYGYYGASTTTGPRQGDNDRGDGATLWGQLRGGRFKYYLGAFGLDQPGTSSPLYAARLSLALRDPEPGYRTSSSYYGGKNILSLAVGGQHQAQGSRSATTPPQAPRDYNELNADVLFEIGNGNAGVLDLEAAFAKMWGEYEPVSYQCFALASYLLPLDIGFGRFQPLVRVQHAGKSTVAGDFTSVDAQLGYIVDGSNARLLTSYQYTKLPGQSQNAVLFGVQLLSHAK